jgi:periplasmic protein TonB
MRILLLCFTILFFQLPASAQPDGSGNQYPVVDTKPRFNGDLNAYLASNLRLPDEYKTTGGRVVVEFLIDTLGNVSNVYVLRASCKKSMTPLEKEVLRVVKMMPPWIPGKLKGRTVAVKYSLPVNIR